MNINRQLEIKESQRFAADDRYMDKLERQQRIAEPMYCMLMRDGKPVWYINIMNKDGKYTGKTKEGTKSELFAYMQRNNYV